jgi:membrane-bound lytic murein transglycosylase D
VEDLQSLNPHIKKNAVPEDGKRRTIKVPKSAKEILTQNRRIILDSAAVSKKQLEALAKASSDYTFGRDRNVYYVRNGDALGIIAQKFRVSIKNLKEWNNLRGNMIRTGQRLIIWVGPSVKANRQGVSTSSIQYPEDPKTSSGQAGTR